jgi:hypothetical protein
MAGSLTFPLVCCLAQALAWSQGTVFFSNHVPPSLSDPIGVDARAYDIAGIAPLTTPPWRAALVLDEGGRLTVVPGSISAFRAGAAQGYVDPSTVAIPNHAGGSIVTLEMMSFRGNTEAEATAALNNYFLGLGLSTPIDVTLSDPSVLPPNMVGLQSFVVMTPEPSVLAIVITGAGILMVLRRKHMPGKPSN